MASKMKIKNGLLSGRGIYVHRCVEYEGDFKKGTGKGRCKNLPGAGSSETQGMVYEGYFRKMQWHGEGTVYDKDGNIIMQGTFKNSKLHGKGKLTMPNVVAEGEWVDGKLSGKGRRVSEDTIEEGTFLNGNLHGKGTVTQTDTNLSVTGTFDNGDWNGKMTITGEAYNGTCDYRKNKRHGYGEFAFPDGATFKGKFKEGACENGEYCYADGRKEVGEFNEKNELIRGYAIDANGNKTKVKKY